MKNIVGLDLGTNSIGFSAIEINEERENKSGKILLNGSRIIPMDAATLGNFDKGNAQSQTAERTRFRSIRRLIERHLQRRERLHKVLHILNFLPKHYEDEIDFDIHPGQIKNNREPKLAWRKNEQDKYEFIFQESFNEMLADFANKQPSLVANGKKVPYDWTIYYLRKKALTQKISGEELAWILLNFNSKRGYYQLRDENEEDDEKKKTQTVEFLPLKVIEVEATDEKRGNDTWYNIHLENGWIYRRTSSTPLDWKDKIKDFIVTTDINEDGSPKLNKYGEVKRSLRAPGPDDWTLIKTKTETDLKSSNETVGSYIYDNLLKDPKLKIKGGLIRVIEREFYKKELNQILETQIKLHPELQDKELYNKCINALYPSNEAYKKSICKRGFLYLFTDDIIFYQRQLKDNKSLIDNCTFEHTEYVDKETGEVIKAPVKCIAKSNPLFQEFRLWHFISDIRIYQKEKTVDDKLQIDVDVTTDFLKSDEDYVYIFKWLNDRKDIDEKTFLKNPIWNFKKRANDYRWNYADDKAYPCNETRNHILTRLNRAGISPEFLNKENEMQLWHILYSVNDTIELKKALEKYAIKHELNKLFVDNFVKFPRFQRDYGSYSAKAIKKLLPLMRRGEYWNFDSIDNSTNYSRIDKMLTEGQDNEIIKRANANGILLTDKNDFKGLPVWLACYVVYNRHSEAEIITKWNSPNDIDYYLKSFRQHSLHNPIVELVIMETLRLVRDIWKTIGHIDEIHIELGREMKSTAEERKKISAKNITNENTNIRIKALLMEFANSDYNIDNVRPYSPYQQDLLKIYEDEALATADVPYDIDEIIKKFNNKNTPTKSEIMKYRLWLEQKYRSPYTNVVIPLSKLFTTAYQIEHIIPRSQYFDDSFNNKVICEAEVNKLKDKELGYEFIEKHQGESVVLSGSMKTVKILSVAEYEAFVKYNYSQSKNKKKNLLLEKIPDSFTNRQLNDSRYISKVIMSLLSNVVREKDENGIYEQEAKSKHVIPCNGMITTRLKHDWGINDIWNDIISPRFERLNELTQTNSFGQWENKDGKRVFQINVPLDIQRGFNKKRIDHRHHVMDALVIACATNNIVNYLNNESTCKDAKIKRIDLQRLICNKKVKGSEYEWIVNKPWDTYTQDVKESLQNITVSFKQDLRIINKTSNYYQHYNSLGKKTLVKQENGDSWAIRKPMHKETYFGLVNLRRIKEVRLSVAIENPSRIVDKKLKEKVLELNKKCNSNKKLVEKYFKENACFWKSINPAKVQIYYFTNESSEPLVAVRKTLDNTFSEETIKNSVTDTGIQKILLNHLLANNNNKEIAFSPDGIDEMNRNIINLNDGKPHQPIKKVRKYEPKGSKFNVGETGNKTSKYVEAEKGTNLFFAIYQTEDGSRIYETIPLNIAVEREKEGKSPVDEKDENDNKLLFWISPNDLVYLPTPDEQENGIDIENISKDRIYKMVSSSGRSCFFIPCQVANAIKQTTELGANNKAEKAWTGEMIKDICIPIKVDRLGRIIKINNKNV